MRTVMQLESAVQPRRPICPACHLPQRTCLCAWLRPTPNAVEVLILQHPLEANQAKGSARLLALSLQRCRMVVAEALDAAALADWLGPDDTAIGDTVLLYPATASAPGPIAEPTVMPRRLVVLDATWRKSLRLLHLNPRLQALPRWPLVDPPAARYGALRKAALPQQLSTLEATCLALAQIEADAPRYAPLLDAFGAWVDDTSTAFRPRPAAITPGETPP